MLHLNTMNKMQFIEDIYCWDSGTFLLLFVLIHLNKSDNIDQYREINTLLIKHELYCVSYWNTFYSTLWQISFLWCI